VVHGAESRVVMTLGKPLIETSDVCCMVAPAALTILATLEKCKCHSFTSIVVTKLVRVQNQQQPKLCELVHEIGLFTFDGSLLKMDARHVCTCRFAWQVNGFQSLLASLAINSFLLTFTSEVFLMLVNPKPYDLVIVQHGDKYGIDLYRHCGQIISRPIGDGTIMVRMVPDDPTTMEQVSLEMLGKPHLKCKWVHYAQVNGFGQFPIDMLRYDFCSPANFTMSYDERDRIVVTIKDGQHDLIVAQCTTVNRPDWTRGRWLSFGWDIKPLKTLKIEGK
jgi:hypothetical protein